MPPGSLLGEDQLSIHRHLEQAPGRLHQAHLCLWKHLFQLSRQTGGPGLVVSDYAILDRDKHDAGAPGKKMEAEPPRIVVTHPEDSKWSARRRTSMQWAHSGCDCAPCQGIGFPLSI